MKNKIFILLVCGILASAGYADDDSDGRYECVNRHIWFGPACFADGGTQNCSGWHFKKNWAVSIDVDADISMQNGATIKYCYDHDGDFEKIHRVDASIAIIDPKGISHSFYINVNTSPVISYDVYIAHDDIRDTGSVLLNMPVDGDITINGNSWGSSLVCDPSVSGANCSRFNT